MKEEKNHFRLWHLPVLVLLIIGAVFAIRTNKEKVEQPYQMNEGVIFGTTFHAKYQYKEDLQEEIMKELGRVDASLSMFNPQSCISRVNNGESCVADSMLQLVLKLSMDISKRTDGAFDVTVAPLVNAWGFGFKQGKFPDDNMVDSLLQFVGWQKVTMRNDTILRKDERTIMDLSAVAKGFGVDMVADLLRRHGIGNFMIEIGGEIVAEGTNPKGEKWRIGINKPDDDSTSTNNELQEVIGITGKALATSGNYRNFYYHEGRKIAHTIDPKSGKPVQHSILSSTVMAPSCAMADGFATAFMVMGVEKAKEVLDKEKDLQAYFIYANEDGGLETWSTEGFGK